jgi:hypothetical protein
MRSAILGLKQRHRVTASGEREALQASVLRHVRVLKAATNNRARRDAQSGELCARNLAQLEDLLGKLKGLAGADGMPPPQPWWNRLMMHIKRGVLMFGVGHGRACPIRGDGG